MKKWGRLFTASVLTGVLFFCPAKPVFADTEVAADASFTAEPVAADSDSIVSEDSSAPDAGTTESGGSISSAESGNVSLPTESGNVNDSVESGNVNDSAESGSDTDTVTADDNSDDKNNAFTIAADDQNDAATENAPDHVDETDTDELVGASEETQSIPDGIYVITSAMNGFKALDISGGSMANGANVQLYDANGTDEQKFDIRWDSMGKYYTIKNVHSGCSLDVAGAGQTNGTNVWQYAENGTDAQKWYILPDANGGYTIVSKVNGLAVDVKEGSTANGTNIWMYTQNGTTAQSFRFLTSAANATISDGVYEIASALDTGKVLDISNGTMSAGGNVQIYQKNNSNAQKFIVTGTGNGTYRITSLNSGMTIDLNNAGGNSGTNVLQSYNSNANAQRWYIRNTGDGTCYFVPAAASENAMDIAGANTANSTNVQIYTANGTNAQKFYLSRTDYSPVTGEYIFADSADQNSVLDIENGSRKMQANLQIYDGNDTTAQKFIIQDEGNGFVSIKNVKSKHLLDVAGGSRDIGANVQQYRDNDTWAQMWIAHSNSDGTYTFINANSSMVLDVKSGRTENGTNVQQYSFNGSAAQKFVLKETTGTDTEDIDYSVEPPKTISPFISIDQASGAAVISGFGGFSIPSDVQASLQAGVNNLTGRGYTTGFIMVDMDSGKGISYNPDQIIYSASTIKGLYVASLCAENPDAARSHEQLIHSILEYSDNQAYASLRSMCGSAYISDWCNKAGVRSAIAYGNYTSYSARELCKLWLQNDTFFNSGDWGSTVGSWYERPVVSPIHSELGGKYTTRTKAGWLYVTPSRSANDAGIVYANNHRYVVSIMSNAPGTHELLQPLVSAIDEAHNRMY